MAECDAVEQPELHLLERPDIARPWSRRTFPRRAAGREMVLDHPLAERLGHHRPGIVDAERVGNAALGRRRWWPARCDRPCSTGRRPRRRYGGQGPASRSLANWSISSAQRRAIGRKVVAAQHGEGRRRPRRGGAPALRPEIHARSAACPGSARSCDDVGMRGVEIAGRIAQIGLFGDRQRDDADARIAQRVQQCRRASPARPAAPRSSRRRAGLSPSLPRTASV